MPSGARSRLAEDFARFGRALPRDWAAVVRERYAIDLSTQYLGRPLPHPIAKGSGQLTLKREQLEADADAGLAFAVLKTVIAQDQTGARTMGAWAVHETRMAVERRSAPGGREGWTVTWTGRGWDRPFEEYLELVRVGRALADAGRLFAVPSVKYHLPRLDEPFREPEYTYTTAELARAWGDGPLPLEKDFSPTLAGDPLTDERAQILRWLAEIPARVRAAAPHGAHLALKLMNARFDDAFQCEMLRAAAGADAVTVFNRLWDAERGVAFGGWELSDRNLRVLDRCAGRPWPWGMSGTGNISSGRQIVAYARRGCSTVQLHTFFQLPLREYPAGAGTRMQRALHALVFHPDAGLVAALLDAEEAGTLHRDGGELRFRDLAASAGAAERS